LDESPSTNAYVADRARAGEPAGLVVVTEHQTAGRGRLDRTWETPRGVALTFSMLVSPAGVPLARWPWLPLLTGLAVVDAVTEVAGVAAALKWPNDVMAGDGKLAGILVELVEQPGGAAAVVGVGLNVSASHDQLPVETATSLALEGAAEVDRTSLLGAVLTSFSARYDGWVGAVGDELRASYLRVCSTLGKQVRAELPGGDTVTGRAVDVDAEGRLHVDDGSRVHVLGAGDVIHVRPG
jgi:BirA family biotin operon repressor/biotin-[acetyl-CoA-carboxylase] ligase